MILQDIYKTNYVYKQTVSMLRLTFVTLFLLHGINPNVPNQEVCYKDEPCSGTSDLRYIFYDVNPPEGFNLRRDVYVRFAVFAHKLQRSKHPELRKFRLVLPPWSRMVHWSYSERPEHVPWGHYFDVSSLKLFAPVVEMYEFFESYSDKYSGVVVLDEVYTLQHFEDMFETGNFEDRMKIDKCSKKYEHNFLFYNNVSTRSYKCLSYHGPATKLTELLLNTTAKTIFFEHAEVALHEFFGDKLYWQARRSMRFSRELKSVADEFRETHLNSSDVEDKTVLPENWTDEVHRREALGGPYLGVHLRRRDFVRNRPNEAPPIEDIARRVVETLKKLRLSKVYVATDGSLEEYDSLRRHLLSYEVLRFNPSAEFRAKYRDGGAGIVDQIICSHARYFIGTSESTFTFRIQEEREILGFPSESTFNAFCREGRKCSEPTAWTIKW